MTTANDDAPLTEYQRKVRWALAALPEADRDDIVAELRSHLLDRVERGASLHEALAALGPAEDYARAFVDEYEVSSALSTRKARDLLSALVRVGRRSVLGTAAGAILLLVWLTALGICYVALLKLSDPGHVGLWSGDNFFFFGIIDDPSSGRELLGAWIGPVAIAGLILAWGVTRWLAARVLRTPR